MNKPRLGRGLDALLGDGLDDDPAPSAPTVQPVVAADKDPAPAVAPSPYREMSVDVLSRGQYQPRSHMDEDALAELAESIKTQGIVQPLVVRETTAGRFEIIAGERRWRAAQRAGLATVPVIVKQIPDEVALAVALIENIQRENLNPVEEAQGIQRLMAEFDLTQAQAAEKVGRSRSAVANLLRLLQLEPSVREHLEHGRLDMGHARCLLGLDGASQRAAAKKVIDEDLSVRDTEALVRRLNAPSDAVVKPKKTPTRFDPEINRLADDISEKLGAPVAIDHKAGPDGGSGRLVISYHSLDELDGIIERIR